MVKFYLTRMEALDTDEARTEYLKGTVSASLRDQVLAAYNEAHPDAPLSL